MLFPVDDFAVGVVRILGAKGWPANQTFEHDSTDRPPITAEGVASAGEDLRGDVVRCANGGVCENTARFAPCVDLCAVADGQIDLVQRNRLPIFALFLVSVTLQELLIV